VDRKIERKGWRRKTILTVAAVTGLALLVAASVYFTSGKSKLNVDAERITISEVKKGSFQEFIPVNGVGGRGS
jgi:HlyD family secretion protein